MSRAPTAAIQASGEVAALPDQLLIGPVPISRVPSRAVRRALVTADLLAQCAGLEGAALGDEGAQEGVFAA
jgi:hypothetical protein